jgi:hypothetical protein
MNKYLFNILNCKCWFNKLAPLTDLKRKKKKKKFVQLQENLALFVKQNSFPRHTKVCPTYLIHLTIANIQSLSDEGLLAYEKES